MEPAYLLAKALLKPWLATWFRWHIEGLENIPTAGPVIIAFNHIAYLDPLAAAYVVELRGRRARFLAKSELFADRRISWILRGAKQIEVRRGSRDAPVALDHAVEALHRGEVVVVFPEGTITEDPDLKLSAPKSGTARMAIASGSPVLPSGLWGTHNIWPKGYARHWWPPKQDIIVRIGEPFHATGDPHNVEDVARVGHRIIDEISVAVAGLRPAIPDRRRQKAHTKRRGGRSAA
jgi:1-acyl-sn-glycerol-3-phosphate acyltransferase